MIVGKVDRPSVKSNEGYWVKLALIGLLDIVTLEFLSRLRITEMLWYVLSLWYRACLLCKPADSVTVAARLCTGSITDAEIPLMRRHDMHSTTPLLNRGTI
jgi:hypothetical protein